MPTETPAQPIISWLGFNYFVWIFLASCGVLQVVAASSKLKGIMFFRQAIASYVCGTLLIAAGFLWFFLLHSPHQWNIRGLEGVQQLGLFLFSAFVALAFTLALASVIKGRSLVKPERSPETEPGLDALKEVTYFEAVRRILRMGKRKGRP